MTEVLVTGGAGFIGSNFVRWAHARHEDWRITTLDKLTYAGRLENLRDVMDSPRHRFVQGDIADAAVAAPLVREADIVVHFAAETHVDRSIQAAGAFIQTDVFGTFVLLEAAREAPNLRRFIQISTDEVYGSVPQGHSRETDELRPRNPYSASKAGADRLAYSYFATYGVPVVITRASNNYGPYQFPEKVIPLFITNAIDSQPLPALRRRHERARLAARGRSLPRHRHGDRARPVGRGLQHRRRQRGRERRPDEAHPDADRAAAVAHPPGGRSARPRSPVRARHAASSQALGWTAARAVRGRAGSDRRLVPRERMVVAADQGTATPPFREYYQTQYGNRPGA